MAECLFIMVVFFYSTIGGLFCHCPFLLDLFTFYFLPFPPYFRNSKTFSQKYYRSIAMFQKKE